jgi:hypothetical protein
MSPVAPGLIAYVGRFESGKYPELTKSSPWLAIGVTA